MCVGGGALQAGRWGVPGQDGGEDLERRGVPANTRAPPALGQWARDHLHSKMGKAQSPFRARIRPPNRSLLVA